MRDLYYSLTQVKSKLRNHMERKIVRLAKIPRTEIVTELIEHMVYYKMSYPTGQKDHCSVFCNDATSEIITPDTTYKLSDEVYLYLYLLSNKAIASIYKIVSDDKED